MRGFTRILTVGLVFGAVVWSADVHAELVPEADDITFEIAAVDGDVSKQAVEEAVKKHTKALESCYARAIEEQEERYSNINRSVFADSDGEVFAVQGGSGDQKGFSLGTCIDTQMRSWTLPETANGGISKVRLSIEFGKAYLRAYHKSDEAKEKRRKMASKIKNKTTISTIADSDVDLESAARSDVWDRAADTSKPSTFKKVYGKSQEEPPEGPHFSRGEKSVAEGIDAELLVANINHRRSAIERCYEQALLNDDSVEGEVNVTVEMGADGKPASVKVDTRLPKTMASCVETAFAPKHLRHLEGKKGTSASVELVFRRSAD